jgi:hypothetical protein
MNNIPVEPWAIGHPNDVAKSIVETACSLIGTNVPNTLQIDLEKRIAYALFVRNIQQSSDAGVAGTRRERVNEQR